MLTREEILARKWLAAVPFRCELGDVHLKRFGGQERRAWDAFANNQLDGQGNIRDTAEFRATLVQMSLCDGEGRLMFAPSDTIKLIEAIPADVQEVIAVASSRLNKLSRYEALDAGFFPKGLTPSSGNESQS